MNEDGNTAGRGNSFSCGAQASGPADGQPIAVRHDDFCVCIYCLMGQK